MPGRNVLKIDIEKSFYHVYIRGHYDQEVFRDDEDYNYFLDLFGRYLSLKPRKDQYKKQYQHLRGDIEMLGYCLMPSYLHLLVYQEEVGAMSNLMKGTLTAYSRYFNKKYQLSGGLFESRYKASRISSKRNLLHISRYIHTVPGNWQAHPYTSIHAYFGVGRHEWLQEEKLTQLFPSLPHYADFLDDRKGYQKSLPYIQHELANTISI